LADDQLKTFSFSHPIIQPSEYEKLEKASKAGDLTNVTIECPPVSDALKYTMPEGVSFSMVFVILSLMNNRMKSRMKGTLTPMIQMKRVPINLTASILFKRLARKRR
jgi:hypothetical protein